MDYTWLIKHSYYKAINPEEWKPEEIVGSYKRRVAKSQLKSNFYSIRIVNLWNSLLEEVVGAPSVNCFEERFDRFCVVNRFSMEWKEI